MKTVYIGIPAHGHTNPTLPVMSELVARGYEALYYNAAWFREKVAPTGADFRAYPEPIPDERAVTEALGEIIAASHIAVRGRETGIFLVQLTSGRVCGIPSLGGYKRPVQRRRIAAAGGQCV